MPVTAGFRVERAFLRRLAERFIERGLASCFIRMRRTLAFLLGRYSGNLNISIPGEVVSGLIISNVIKLKPRM